MKSASLSFLTLYRLALLALICIGLQGRGSMLLAQNIGSQAEAAQEESQFQQNLHNKRQPAPASRAHDDQSPTRVSSSTENLWGHSFSKQFQPSRPQQAIPLFLSILGLLLMALWGGLLAATILVTSASLMTLFLILTIVLSPLLVIGLVFLIGGLIAGFSGGRKKKIKAQTEATDQG